jgi:hypothetical protein
MIDAMAEAYLRALGVGDSAALLRFAATIIERVESRPAGPREDVLLTAFDELQRLIGAEVQGDRPVPGLDGPEAASLARLRFVDALAVPAEAQPILPLAGPVAPRLTMEPQTLETWVQRMRAVCRRGAGAFFGAPATEPLQTIRAGS